MARPRAKYAAVIPATDAANRVNGAHRSHRFRSQCNAYQLQKTPSAIGSAKAPNADWSPLRARRPSKKSVARASSDTQREAGAREGSRPRNTVSRFGHPNEVLSPRRPKWLMHKNQDVNAQPQLPTAPASV